MVVCHFQASQPDELTIEEQEILEVIDDGDMEDWVKVPKPESVVNLLINLSDIKLVKRLNQSKHFLKMTYFRYSLGTTAYSYEECYSTVHDQHCPLLDCAAISAYKSQHLSNPVLNLMFEFSVV